MIMITGQEMDLLLAGCHTKTFRKKEFLCFQNNHCHDVFFIQKGLTRNIIIDRKGKEHTTHFAFENQFITDYSSFLMQTPCMYSIQALEITETIVMPRSVVTWGYQNLKEGDRLGRLIAEYYFIFHDNQIRNQFTVEPAERYNKITELFPDIHNRVPQHMIASYLGITPIHLSRLKKANRKF